MQHATPEHYDADYYRGNEQDGDRVALWFYARVAARLAHRGDTVLDFGSGVGHFTRRLAGRFRTIAFDLSPYARQATAERSPSTRVVADLDEVAQGSVDVVCTLHVLEHIPDPAPTFAAFARVLRPNGRLLFVVPNPQGWGYRIKGERWFAYRDDSHCSLFDRDRWVQLAEDAGFTVDRVNADGLWDPPYVGRIPRLVQLVTLGLPAVLQVAAGRLFLPADHGECIVVTARLREPRVAQATTPTSSS